MRGAHTLYGLLTRIIMGRVAGFQEAVVGISQHLQIIWVGDVQYIPSIGREGFLNILGHGNICQAIGA